MIDRKRHLEKIADGYMGWAGNKERILIGSTFTKMELSGRLKEAQVIYNLIKTFADMECEGVLEIVKGEIDRLEKQIKET